MCGVQRDLGRRLQGVLHQLRLANKPRCAETRISMEITSGRQEESHATSQCSPSCSRDGRTRTRAKSDRIQKACPQCSYELRANARFCPKCGLKMDAAASPATPAAVLAVTSPAPARVVTPSASPSVTAPKQVSPLPPKAKGKEMSWRYSKAVIQIAARFSLTQFLFSPHRRLQQTRALPLHSQLL
jgi:hypothetical protein